MSLPFTQIVGDPTLRDLMDLVKKEILLSMNCHSVATVKDFNSEFQTVSAVINYAQVYYQRDGNGVYKQVVVDYPPLIECPIVNLSGGGNYLTFPVSAGDQCIILFNDRDLDNYFSEKMTTELASARLHAFQDAIAIVCSGNVSIDSYDPVRVLLTNGTSKVGYNPNTNKLTLTNGTPLSTVLDDITALSSSLSSILTNLIADLSAVLSPMQIAALTAQITALTVSISLANTAIGDLLE